MTYFALLGYPLTHSLSPLVHQAFAKSVGISLRYEKIETPLGQLKQALHDFRAKGGIGANITAPLKQEAFGLCDYLTQNALLAKAVNTLYWENEKLKGDNTDGEGLIRDLTINLALNLSNKRILILGAGGAVRGILFPLLSRSIQSLVIVNRTLLKAQSLAQQDPRLKAYTYEGLDQSQEHPFDIIINATSLSLEGMLPPLNTSWIKNAMVLDLAYDQQAKLFMQWAKSHGASATYDGLGMLVEQAALAFERWHHILPITAPVIHSLRQREDR